MGYTHYWRRPGEVKEASFRSIIEDFKNLLPALESMGVKLAGGNGTGEARIGPDVVSFNGPENCGHEHFELCITWPAPKASGVSLTPEAVDGTWFAGRQLEKRCCGGDCSHETLYFPQVIVPEKWRHPKNGKYFEFCKTAYKPYDLAVTAFLVVAKHHLGKQLVLTSDGDIENWQEAGVLCQIELGYGLDFQLN